ncbi:mitochondrial 54S ribosomal protein YmL28 [Scheffersomyces xylosifermentans]|uniref:mitochondrial 54S ribosomal protein YmL28 n=1 Tax=Scheffersomyces xylosifermentans TaxID=1304137 RepID=UPI00315D56E9
MFNPFRPSTISGFPSGSVVLKTFVRGKRQSTQSASTKKVVNQLSALSASRKQPKLLNLCNEDLIKHRTIVNAWKMFKRREEQRRHNQLKKQYKSIYNAMEDLKQTSPKLFELANAKEEGKRFPLEMRVPTDFPPTQPWVYNYSPKKETK